MLVVVVSIGMMIIKNGCVILVGVISNIELEEENRQLVSFIGLLLNKLGGEVTITQKELDKLGGGQFKVTQSFNLIDDSMTYKLINEG